MRDEMRDKENKLYLKEESKSRMRTENYETYIKVREMEEKGLDEEHIAKKVYRSDVERGDLNYAKRKARRDLDRCQKCIDEVYRQIR
jgi:transcriptional regulator